VTVFRTPVPTLSLNDLLTTRLRAKNTWLTIVKASAAAGIAWFVASALSPSEAPVLAPVLALTTVRSSLYSTLAQGLQTLAGILIGVALALLVIDVFQLNDFVVFGSAFMAFTVARLLPISSGARDQIPLIVLFVVLLDPGTDSYGASRLVDAVIGSLVGIVVALAVPERPHLDAAVKAIDAWRASLATTLDEVGSDLDTTDHAVLPPEAQHAFMTRASEELRTLEDVAIDDVIAADQSVRFNIRAHSQRHQVLELSDTVDWLQRVSLHVQAIALGVDELYDRGTAPLPRLPRSAMASLVRHLATMLRAGAIDADLRAASDRITAAIDAALDTVTHGGPDLATVLESVSLLGRVDQLRGELVGEVLDAPPDLLD
jgi:uncharacterized membrane protein YgaE (UPF0421/DUF939 family)